MGDSGDPWVSAVTTEAPIVVAVMGITGSGKSTFIQKATGSPDIEIGHGLKSCTETPKMYTCTYGSKQLILVDTPGFDDTFRDDAQVLQEVATFLEATYKKNIKLSGIIYLHDITNNKMGHAATANLAMFQALCGDDPLKNVILATTRWGDLQQDARDRAVDFEDELTTEEKFWGGMVEKGSRVLRFQNSRESAFEILRPLIKRAREMTLQIQQEMAVENRSLAKTSAGEQLNKQLLELEQKLEQQLLKHKKEIEDAKSQHNTTMEEWKTNEARKTQAALRKIQDEGIKLREDRRDEVRQFDMKMNQLTKRLAEQEKETVQQLENEIEQLKTTQQATQEERDQAQKQIKEKLAAKTKKEKWIGILSAVGTTAAAAGLSVINPLAIPVAVNGGIALLNAIFSRSKANPDPSDVVLIEQSSQQV